MNVGKNFENQFRKSVPKDVLYYRNKDTDLSWCGGNSKFTPKSEFDCLLFDGYNLFILELKSTKESRISFGDNGMIKTHQIRSLNSYSHYKNCISGFIFNFRDNSNFTCFLSVRDFDMITTDTEKKSVNIKEIAKYCIPIDNKLLRIQYSYDIAGFCLKFAENINV